MRKTFSFLQCANALKKFVSLLQKLYVILPYEMRI
jgi:hypothetical protein